MQKIILDGMGGDNAPTEIVKGAVSALKEREGYSLVITGDEKRLSEEFGRYDYDRSRVEIRHCTQIIEMNDVPTSAVRSKRDSSLVVGLNALHREEDAVAFLSAGSTGAVLTGGIMFIGRIEGVMRPALCPAIPNVRGTRTLLCDAGANAECKSEYLKQFAIMATAYARAAYQTENPRVGLLNNGTEEHKGDQLHQEAYKLLRETEGINFIGNIEGRDIMFGDVDVAVADGFSGNIALKSIEGCGKTVSAVLKREFSASAGRKLGYLFARGAVSGLKKMLDYNRFGGAVFLGLKKPVLKIHGASRATTVTAAILQATDIVNGGLVEKIVQTLPYGESER